MSEPVSWEPWVQTFVPGLPIPQPRPRFSARGGFVKVYTPKSDPVHQYKKRIALMIRQELTFKNAMGLDEPWKLALRFWMDRPKNKIWKKKEMVPYPCAVKPDIDNLVKSTMDAMSLAWKDDSRVVVLVADKWYIGAGQVPGTEIEIWRQSQ